MALDLKTRGEPRQGRSHPPTGWIASGLRPSPRRAQKGQTTLEYLMLMSLAFITAYLIMTVGIGPFTRNMVFGIRLGLLNVIQNAELSRGAPATPGQAGHPSDGTRFQPLHL